VVYDGILVFDQRCSQVLSSLDVSFCRGEGFSEVGERGDAVALVLHIALFILADEAIACVGDGLPMHLMS
jgi:hypothetical protein